MEKDLLVIAKEHELQGFQKNEDIFSRIAALEEPLNDVYSIRRPNAVDYNDRRNLIHFFNEIAREILGNRDECPVVKEFGSFLMDMFDAKSDLDLSINFSGKKVEPQRDAKINTLRKFTKKLRALQKAGHIRNVQPIFSARVPVLKVTDLLTGIECDLSVGNLDGIAKSHIIGIISAIDERFQKLSFLMKAWAKAHDINSSKDGTLNSLSLILLVAFHLQTRQPPIFPRFSTIFEDGTDPVAVKKVIPSFLNYGKENKESVAELFVSLLIVLESVETLWPKGLCASVFEGSWVFKTWKSKKSGTIGCISIEDFTDRSQNTARAVRSGEMSKIYSCIRRSLQLIRSFINGKLDAVKLKNRLFGPDPLVVYKGINDKHPPNNPISEDYTQRKRKHITRGGLTRTKRKRKHLTKGDSLQSNKDTEKPCMSSFLLMASSQKEATRVDRSQETIGETQSRLLTHSALSSQGSTGIPHHHAPYSHSALFSQGSTQILHHHELYSQSRQLSHSALSSQGSTGIHQHYEPYSQSRPLTHSARLVQDSTRIPHHREPYSQRRLISLSALCSQGSTRIPHRHEPYSQSHPVSHSALCSQGSTRIPHHHEPYSQSCLLSHSAPLSQGSTQIPHYHAPYFPHHHEPYFLHADHALHLPHPHHPSYHPLPHHPPGVPYPHHPLYPHQ